MTFAESPQHPPELERSRSRATSEPASELPGLLEPWVDTLILWPVLDEPTYRLVARCFGDGRGPEWDFLAPVLLHAGLVEPGPAPGTFTFRTEWLPALRRSVVAVGGADVARAKLVAAWLDAPDRNLVAEVAGWASDLASWGAIDAIWNALSEHTGDLPPEALEVYRDLPPEARKAWPMLTWASGGAKSLLTDPHQDDGEATLRRLLQDSALLHSDWSEHSDSDAAVGAGTIRMIGERRMPTTQAGHSLQAAWRTKQEVDAFINTRSRSSHRPGRAPRAVFRAFSGLLALFLDDLQRAISAARWASLLCDWEPVCALAAAAGGEPGASADGPAAQTGAGGTARPLPVRRWRR